MDIGGTLLSDDNTISAENLNAIKEIQKRGAIITLVTAREYSSTKYISKQIGCNYGVFSNGSHLLDIDRLKTLKTNILQKQAVLDIYNFCKTNNLYIHLNQEFCEVSDQMEYFNLKHNILNESYPEEYKSSCYLVENLKNHILSNDITKIVIVSDKNLNPYINELNKILKIYGLFITEYNRNLNEHIINRIINYVEIGATNDTKATGLTELVEILKIPKEEVLVMGDGDNDLEMLSTFSNSVCMANGNEKAKSLSKYITLRDNNNSGVAEGIRHYFGGM